MKQRPNAARPRLPATGKIGDGTKSVNVSPAKRPPPNAAKKSNTVTFNTETEGPSKKKKKSNAGQAVEVNGDSAPVMNGTSPVKKDTNSKNGKLKITLPTQDSIGGEDEGGVGGEAPKTPTTEMNGVDKVNGITAEGESAMMSPESI